MSNFSFLLGHGLHHHQEAVQGDDGDDDDDVDGDGDGGVSLAGMNNLFRRLSFMDFFGGPYEARNRDLNSSHQT